jgi:hypothetical protein
MLASKLRDQASTPAATTARTDSGGLEETPHATAPSLDNFTKSLIVVRVETAEMDSIAGAGRGSRNVIANTRANALLDEVVIEDPNPIGSPVQGAKA